MLRRVRSYSAKLTLLVALPCIVALLLASVTMSVVTYLRLRDLAVANLVTHGRMLAIYSEAPMSFGDAAAANEALSVLRSDPNVALAVLRQPGGETFARYQRADIIVPRLSARGPGHYFESGWLVLTLPVSHGQDVLGSLTLTYDMSELSSRARLNLLGTLGVGFAATLLAILIARRLEKDVVKPVLELVRVAHDVAQTKDYSIRAEQYARDELGQLTDAFNEMLRQIQSQNADLDNARKWFEIAVESSPSAMVMVDEQGKIVLVNAQTEKLFGYGRTELIGQPVEILVPHRFRAGHPSFRKGFFATPATRAMGQGRDLYGLRKDGTEVPVEIGLNPIQTDEGPRVLSAIVDITARKQAEQEREDFLQAERTARNEAERTSRMKDEFLATVSHELRTPLNAILGWAQLLRQGAKPSDEDLTLGLETIERNSRQQAKLIEDLLDTSRIISGKLRLEVQDVDLPAVLQAACETVRPAADARGVALQLVIDAHAGPIRGDPNRLQQVVWNLLSNAIKFTARGGKVQVSLSRVNSHVEITVADTGLGIEAEFLPYLFEHFRQADSSISRKHGGLGLGLALVKQLVTMHGGTVAAHSKGLGQGATFVVNLPVSVLHRRVIEPEKPVEELLTPSALQGISVLVVDDEPDAAILVKRVLEEAGAKVMIAGSAVGALELLKSGRPDVLLSDIGMPEQDGLQLIRSIRALPAGEGGAIPAAAISALARSEDRTRAMLAGYHTHIAKPANPSEIVAVVATLARRTGQGSVKA